jgi:hypothetical protein
MVSAEGRIRACPYQEAGGGRRGRAHELRRQIRSIFRPPERITQLAFYDGIVRRANGVTLKSHPLGRLTASLLIPCARFPCARSPCHAKAGVAVEAVCGISTGASPPGELKRVVLKK